MVHNISQIYPIFINNEGHQKSQIFNQQLYEQLEWHQSWLELQCCAVRDKAYSFKTLDLKSFTNLSISGFLGVCQVNTFNLTVSRGTSLESQKKDLLGCLYASIVSEEVSNIKGRIVWDI